MACRLLDAMPFHEPMQTYSSMDLLNKLYERIWYEPFIAYVWHCQGCIEVYCLFKLVKIDTCDGLSPDQWRAISWTTADLLFMETFWTNSGFTLLKPSLLWFATFKKTSLSGNHTARPLCGDHTGLVGSLHRDQQCVSLGVSLNKFYDVIEVISVLLVPCAGNPQTSGFPSQMVGSGDSESFNNFFINIGPTLAKSIPFIDKSPLNSMGDRILESLYLQPVTC